MDESARLKLAPWVIKRNEEPIGRSYFYNAKIQRVWSTELSTGIVVSALDGSLTFSEIIEILTENNPDIDKEELKNSFIKLFDELEKEDFIINVS